MRKIYFKSLFIALLFIYSGCGDNFLNKVNETAVNSGTFYQTEGDAISSVNAAYAPLQNLSLWARRIHFMLDFSSDEIGPTPNTQGAPFELIQHTFGPTGNEHIDNPWNMFYRAIAKTNITIENVSKMENIDGTVKNQVIAQAKFIRALSYFYINALWNGGPLKTDENTNELNTGRATPSEIWVQIENDLSEAANNLPTSWDDTNLGRVTKGAALALHGKALLYQEKWAEADAKFTEVMGLGYYLIGGDDDPSGAATTIEEAIAAMRTNHDFGVKNNGEAIFEVQFASGAGGLSWSSGDARGLRESTIRPREYGVDGNAFYNAKPSDKLIAEYEGNGGTGIGDRDPRMEAFFFTENSTFKGEPYMPIFETSGYAWKKYQDETDAAQNDNDCNHDVIRYADVILMSAEAKINQGNVAGGIELINKIRKRADPSGTILPPRDTGISQAAALDFLIHERFVELCGEQVRRTDLVRWGIAKDNIANFQAGKHEYFPIPQNEIDANQELTDADQNPGY
ncbi:RagB/SusD family nutrient uptake outer membrane protein [Flexithrix dorotheae]|uniref:RagB/SusD family nutrient uptake outer membrane protein n=1 Tax=Flexithrix dorotheae TaxID=70993 RepID=UPI00037440F0|nr:RagB/SusD family nutrient uptake outer membrane protein [Flexithrix dorotheae]